MGTLDRYAKTIKLMYTVIKKVVITLKWWLQLERKLNKQCVWIQLKTIQFSHSKSWWGATVCCREQQHWRGNLEHSVFNAFLKWFSILWDCSCFQRVKQKLVKTDICLTQYQFMSFNFKNELMSGPHFFFSLIIHCQSYPLFSSQQSAQVPPLSQFPLSYMYVCSLILSPLR